jgi:DNA polymerase-3 subunit delta
MAARSKKDNGSHAYRRFDTDLKKDRLEKLVFLHGSESLLIDWAVRQIVGRYVTKGMEAVDLVRFDTNTFHLDPFVEACETLPMLSPRKVVLLENFSYVWRNGRSGIFDDEIRDKFCAYLPQLADTTLLVVAADDPDDDRLLKPPRKMAKTLCKEGQEYDFKALGQRDLLGFLKKRLVSAGHTASRGTLEMLIAESGYRNEYIDYGLGNLDGDLKKIMALAEAEEITPEDVRLGLSDNIEHNVFEMLDSISVGRRDEALRLIHGLLLSGTNEMKLLATIIGQLELMLEVGQLCERHYNQQEMAKLLKVHPYRVKKASGFAARCSEAQLMHILQSALAVDTNIKSGLFDAETALLMFLASF